jgi:hypothetical protein
MGKRLLETPKSKIRAALRNVFLRSREHASALKQANNTCQVCGKKKSVAKGKECAVRVHHINGVHNWEEIFVAIRKELLCDPSFLTIMCTDCHDKHHKEN